MPTSLCENTSLSSPKENVPNLRDLVVMWEVIAVLFMLYLDRVHWCATCCSWLWIQLDDDLCPNARRSEGRCRLYCATVAFLTRFSVCGISGRPYWPDGGYHCCVKVCGVLCKNVIPFLKYACAFVIPFWSHWVLIGPHAEEKCACNQLANGCVHMFVCLPVYVKN